MTVRSNVRRVTTPSDQARKVPGPVLGSFWILVASAVLRVVVAVITLATWQTIVNDELRGGLPAKTTLAQATAQIHTELTANIALDLVFAALYVLFAFYIKAGRRWARTTLTVIIVVFGLFDILGGTDIFTLIEVVIELVAVGMLYLPNTRAYFAPTERIL